MATIMLALSVTISKITTVKIMHIHDVDLWVEVKYKYIDRKPTNDSLFVGNCNDCHIGHHFQAICYQNMHDLDYDQ